MRKILLGAVAACAVASVAFVGGAQAQSPCAWNGYTWVCSPNYNAGPQYYGGYPYPSQDYAPAPYGYKQEWLPSYPGPKLSGGSGR